MQISKLEWRGIRVPLRDLERALDPTKAGRNALIIWMHMDNGIVGIGEAAPVGPGRPPGHCVAVFVGDSFWRCVVRGVSCCLGRVASQDG